jgi:hypothetical protein
MFFVRNTRVNIWMRMLGTGIQGVSSAMQIQDKNAWENGVSVTDCNKRTR